MPESSVSSSLYRAQRSAYPSLPTASDEIGELPEVFAFIGVACEKKFLLLKTLENANGALMFIMDDGLRTLAEYNKWYVDGSSTFSATAHYPYSGVSEANSFAVLQTKSKQTYSNLFTVLKDAATARHLALAPESLHVNFEAVLLSLRGVCCYGHLRLLVPLHSV